MCEDLLVIFSDSFKFESICEPWEFICKFYSLLPDNKFIYVPYLVSDG